MKRQFKCDLCPRPATIHQTERSDSKVIISHFCDDHQPAAYTKSLVQQLRTSFFDETCHQTVIEQMSREFDADPEQVVAVMLESLKRLSSHDE